MALMGLMERRAFKARRATLGREALRVIKAIREILVKTALMALKARRARRALKARRGRPDLGAARLQPPLWLKGIPRRKIDVVTPTPSIYGRLVCMDGP